MPTSKETPTIPPPPSSPPPPPTTTTTTTTTTAIFSPPPPNHHHPHPHPILLALSGPTSSGKTTLATALHALLPPPTSLLIHADDFYKPDSEIPLKNGVQDWDCAGSLDLEAFEGVLRGVKTGGGEVPEGLLRQGNFEGCDGDGEGGSIGREVLGRLRAEEVGTTVQEVLRGRTLVIVDGFLLFGRSIPPSLKGLFDIKILLRARYEDAKRRRERRNGYVTVEGFWRDPEGYFDGVVWPNYVGEYGGLVEGEGEGEGRGVRVSDERWGLEECLEWVVGVVRGEVEALDARGGDVPGG